MVQNFSKFPIDKKIWRYINVEKFLDIFLNSHLCFIRIDLLNDPTEGMLYYDYLLQKSGDFINSDIIFKNNLSLLKYIAIKENREKLPITPNENLSFDNSISSLQNFDPSILKNHLDRKKELFIQKEKESLKRFFVNCWHVNENESMEMWKIYSNRCGIAIQTTLGSLLDSFPVNIDIDICDVQYDDDLKSFDYISLEKRQIFFKHWAYKFEQEIRCLYFNPSSDDKSIAADVFPLSVDFMKLKPHIIISPYIEPWVVNVIKKISEKFGPNISSIRQSSLPNEKLNKT
ncbi:hypothetical protein KHC33_04110 [Methanospirillum sp. J.3.6.1-F.2.7.3]|uniref:DUF2971 domain-containing protein n=1 Tax=Methanospirillum purgamenti TaxID=2834276 RepID=A0A8E7AXU0_9EURY|nr:MULTISPECIES: hypothetical protein [Methanospirillum]MDX8551775.1 hypothetical protein [Methanospirillum hungatei]QVV89707.1 hypothetical protein KHC33_04110 [Methanospirillum sp. J.3.6.1-F.2.7.3]